LRISGGTRGMWDAAAGQPDLDRSVKTFRACLLYFLPKASAFFMQNRPAAPRTGAFGEDVASRRAAVVRLRKGKEKTRGGFLRAGF
jgi:hypothetical protein